MSLKFPKLFEAGYIGKMQLSNRIVKSATGTRYANWDGSVSERLIRFYEEQAQGGSSLIIVELTYVDEIGSQPNFNTPNISDIRFRQGFSLLSQAIQEKGAKAGLQLCHIGILRMIGPPIKTPSPLSKELLTRLGISSVPEELSIAEVVEIENAFGDCALTAKQVGFDMVEVHAAHGYLITEFLSPLINRRTDAYGGTLKKRMHFLLRIIDNVRKKIGPDFPLGVRLTGTEYVTGGITIEESIEIAKALENAGVDVLHISGGSRYVTGDTIVLPAYHSEGFNVWAAAEIKKAVNIPVIASGAITTPELAEQILEERKADFIGLARPLFADPYFPKKAKEGRVDDIVPCIRCNDGCLRPERRRFGSVRCTVNVSVGKEDKFKIEPVAQPKRVAVVGGGPGGLEAARVAGLLGHEVTLFEKRELGGLLIEASTPEFKIGLKRLIKYYSTQIRKLKIKVVKKEVNVEDFRRTKFDAIIVAVGSTPQSLEIQGADKPMVLGVLDVLNNKVTVGERVIVVGGGPVGCDVSLFLANQGKKVILVEMLGEIGKEMDELEKEAFLAEIGKKDVQIYTNTKVKEVIDNGVILTDDSGRIIRLETDQVVLSTGFTPSPIFNILEQVVGEGTEIRRVGDCVSPRKIFDAIHEGHLAARNL